MESLKTVLNCNTPGCPKSNIWQSMMIIALCGMAVVLAGMGVAAESFREVIYILGGAIAFIKLNWNQGQIMVKADVAATKAETAAAIAVTTKASLEKKIDEKAGEIQQTAAEARDTAAESVLATLDGNKLLEEVHKSSNGEAKKKEEDAYKKGLEEGSAGSKF